MGQMQLTQNEKAFSLSLVPSFNDGLADAPAAGVTGYTFYFGST